MIHPKTSGEPRSEHFFQSREVVSHYCIGGFLVCLYVSQYIILLENLLLCVTAFLCASDGEVQL